MQASSHYCVFDTALGPCGVAWTTRGLARLQLPQANRAATEKRLWARSDSPVAADPPPAIAAAISEIQRYCEGAKVDFAPVVVDLADAEPFHRAVYEVARAIGWGETATYGDLARQAGAPREAQGVGQAMSRNPVPIVIPCHRVLAKGGKIGGFSAYGGTFTKERLLALEGVHLDAGAPLLPGVVARQHR